MASSPLSAPSPASPSPVRRKKSRVWLIALSIIVIIIIGISMANAKKRAANSIVRVTTEKASVKTITQTVSATGKIQPEVEVKITPEVAGEIIELPFREGALVKKGDLLISIKPDNYRFQVDQRDADLAASRAAALDSKVRLGKAQEDFKRNDALFAKNLLSEAEHDASKATFEGAQASYESATANIRRAEGNLRQAQDQLAKTTIYSPIDGSVSSRSMEVGERVVATGSFSGSEIMRIADLTNMEVRVNINENDIVNVKVGDKARVAIDAFPGRKFDAIVKEIGSAAKTTGQNTQEEVTNFQVKIRVLDKNVPVRPGMSANADIETKTATDVVAVPIQSVAVRARDSGKTMDQLATDRQKPADNAGGPPPPSDGPAPVNDKQQKQRERADRDALQRVVFVRSGDTVKMIPVETGIADTTYMEIKSGIKDGDEVVSGSYAVITKTLTNDMKVKVDEPKKPAGK